MTNVESRTNAEPKIKRRPFLASLRARLVASHVFVILLALALVLIMSAGFLRRYEERAEIARLRELAEPLAVEASTFAQVDAERDRVRARLDELLVDQANQLNVRLLLIAADSALVIFDSDEARSLRDQRLSAYADAIASVTSGDRPRLDIETLRASPPGDADPLARYRVVLAAGGQSSIVLAIAAPPNRFPLIGRFLPPLMVVAGISLAVASGAGLWLSRRIAAPVNRLTRAADDMASGHLEQQVAGGGADELGRLVASFNAMSHKVAETDRIQREFLATIAHELRTPLTSIQGYALALRDGVAESEQDVDRALATIGQESERMASLIRQLLDLARLESGQARLTMAPLAVEPLLARVAERFALDAEQQGIALAADAPLDLRITGDEERLVQILSNLVGNALHHTPAGGRISLTGAPVASADGATAPRVRVTVDDTGAGIPPERLTTIFNRFERGEGPGDGFGLGLAIVKELVQLHGGSISVQSRLGAGTAFSIDLPSA